MTQCARWIRLGTLEPLELHAARTGIAAATAARGAPAILWAQTRTVPRALEWQYRYAVIAPKRLAPGRPGRWCAWALSPAVAAYRDFGLRAYLNGSDVWLHGRRIAGSGATSIGECAVIGSNFLAIAEWAAHGEPPTERTLEAAFRARFEAQYGWQFDSAWPTPRERSAIDEARAGNFRDACASLAW